MTNFFARLETYNFKCAGAVRCCKTISSSDSLYPRCCEFTNLTVVFVPAYFEYGSFPVPSLNRNTASCASITSPCSYNNKLPPFPTTAHVLNSRSRNSSNASRSGKFFASSFETKPKSSISPFAFGTFGSFGPSFECNVNGPLKVIIALFSLVVCVLVVVASDDTEYDSSSSSSTTNHARRNLSNISSLFLLFAILSSSQEDEGFLPFRRWCPLFSLSLSFDVLNRRRRRRRNARTKRTTTSLATTFFFLNVVVVFFFMILNHN